MASEFTVVIAYDISRANLRRRAVKLLQKNLSRVQKSVFEGRMTEITADQLYDRINQFLEPADRLRMYVITAHGLSKCRADGGTPIADDAAYWLL